VQPGLLIQQCMTSLGRCVCSEHVGGGARPQGGMGRGARRRIERGQGQPSLMIAA
jgi:hypothetical protein